MAYATTINTATIPPPAAVHAAAVVIAMVVTTEAAAVGIAILTEIIGMVMIADKGLVHGMHVNASTTVPTDATSTKTAVAWSMTLHTALRVPSSSPLTSGKSSGQGTSSSRNSKYDNKENLELWITLYEITVRSGMGDEHVMANYLPIILDQASHQWFLSLPKNSIDSWVELRETFLDNFIATYDTPGNKYDL